MLEGTAESSLHMFELAHRSTAVVGYSCLSVYSDRLFVIYLSV
jgi:hypothetical protein